MTRYFVFRVNGVELVSSEPFGLVFKKAMEMAIDMHTELWRATVENDTRKWAYFTQNGLFLAERFHNNNGCEPMIF